MRDRTIANSVGRAIDRSGNRADVPASDRAVSVPFADGGSAVEPSGTSGTIPQSVDANGQPARGLFNSRGNAAICRTAAGTPLVITRTGDTSRRSTPVNRDNTVVAALIDDRGRSSGDLRLVPATGNRCGVLITKTDARAFGAIGMGRRNGCTWVDQRIAILPAAGDAGALGARASNGSVSGAATPTDPASWGERRDDDDDATGL